MVTTNKTASFDSEILREYQKIINENTRIQGNWSRSITEHMISVIEENKKKSRVLEERLKLHDDRPGNDQQKSILDSLGIDWILEWDDRKTQNKIQDSLTQEENERLTYALKRTYERFVSICPEGKFQRIEINGKTPSKLGKVLENIPISQISTTTIKDDNLDETEDEVAVKRQ